MRNKKPVRSFREKFVYALALCPAQSLGALAVSIAFSRVFSISMGAKELLLAFFLPLFLSLLEGIHVRFSVLGFFAWASILFMLWRTGAGNLTICFAVTAAIGVIRIFRRLPGGLIGCTIALLSAAVAPELIGTPNTASIVLVCISLFLMFPVFGETNGYIYVKKKAKELFFYFGILSIIFLLAFGLTALIKSNPDVELFNKITDAFSSFNRITSASPDFELYQTGYHFGGSANPGNAPVFRVNTSINANLRCKVYTEYTSSGWKRPNTTQQYPLSILTMGKRDGFFDNNLPDSNDLPEALLQEYEMHITPLASMHSIPIPVRFTSLNFAQGETPFPVFNNLGDLFTDDYYTTVSITGTIPNTRSKAFSEWMLENADSLEESAQKMEELRTLYCQLPDNLPESVRFTAKARAGSGNSYQKAKNIEQWLSTNMEYTLTPNYHGSRDFVESFLQNEEGYCVHFATAMVVLLRCEGIPARFVTGYAVLNSGESVITEKAGHAWCEVYFEGIGWIPFEPTAAGYEDGQPLPGTDNSEDSAEPAFNAETPTPSATTGPIVQTDGTSLPVETIFPSKTAEIPTGKDSTEQGENTNSSDALFANEDTDSRIRNSRIYWFLLIIPAIGMAVLCIYRYKLRRGIVDDWRCIEYAIRLLGIRRRGRAEPILTYAQFAEKTGEGMDNFEIVLAAHEVETHLFGTYVQKKGYIKHAQQQMGTHLLKKNPFKYANYRIYCLFVSSCQVRKSKL